MKLFPKNDLSLLIAMIGIVVPIWKLLEIYIAIKNNAINPSAQVYPDFFLVTFPALCTIITLVGTTIELSIAGILSIGLNIISVIVGKIYLPAIKEIILK